MTDCACLTFDKKNVAEILLTNIEIVANLSFDIDFSIFV